VAASLTNILFWDFPSRKVCAASPKQVFPPNFKRLPADVYTPDLIAACDCMLGMLLYSEGVYYHYIHMLGIFVGIQTVYIWRV
jgi:hypothetical protein